jgi:hypothetical protein
MVYVRSLFLTLITVAAFAAAPAHASAAGASGFRCAAIPVTGTVLGQALPVPSTGTVDKDCVAGSVAPTLDLPAPLNALLSIQAVNGVTTVSDDGVYAGAGLANLKIGSIPIPIPAIPIPDALKKIDIGGLITVDLTPAIEAIQSLPSKNLLEAGVLYSQGIGSCNADGTPNLAGQSRVANASILGLPVDASNTVDSAINLVDTTKIALSTLDLSLAKVTVLGQTLNINVAQIALLKPILANLPDLVIPAQVAQVKLTPSSQTVADGALVQRALRAQISLAGQSIADLAIGTVVVGGGVCEKPATPIAPDVPASAPAPQVALACTTRKLALIDVLRQGDHVRLFGAADKSLAGKIVSIVFQATGKVVAQVRVGKDGAFTTTAPLPRASIRNTNRARYVAKAGGERSLNLKLARRMIVTSISSKGGSVTIRGKVVRPLAKPVAPIILKRRVTCKTLETVKTFKPKRNGTFSVTVKKPANLAAAIYRLQTRVRRTTSSTKTSPTFTLPRAVDL